MSYLTVWGLSAVEAIWTEKKSVLKAYRTRYAGLIRFGSAFENFSESNTRDYLRNCTMNRFVNLHLFALSSCIFNQRVFCTKIVPRAPMVLSYIGSQLHCFRRYRLRVKRNVMMLLYMLLLCMYEVLGSSLTYATLRFKTFAKTRHDGLLQAGCQPGRCPPWDFTYSISIFLFEPRRYRVV